MFFAINVLALILVLGLCWFAMVWLSGRYHGHGHIDDDPQNSQADPAPSRGSTSSDKLFGSPTQTHESCQACEGLGAHAKQGRVVPCTLCHGTGVVGA